MAGAAEFGGAEEARGALEPVEFFVVVSAVITLPVPGTGGLRSCHMPITTTTRAMTVARILCIAPIMYRNAD